MRYWQALQYLDENEDGARIRNNDLAPGYYWEKENGIIWKCGPKVFSERSAFWPEHVLSDGWEIIEKEINNAE